MELPIEDGARAGKRCSNSCCGAPKSVLQNWPPGTDNFWWLDKWVVNMLLLQCLQCASYWAVVTGMQVPKRISISSWSSTTISEILQHDNWLAKLTPTFCKEKQWKSWAPLNGDEKRWWRFIFFKDWILEPVVLNTLEAHFIYWKFPESFRYLLKFDESHSFNSLPYIQYLHCCSRL